MVNILEKLDIFDRKLFLFLNEKHTELYDNIMAYVTSMNFWIPFYVLLLLFLIWKFKYNLRFTIYDLRFTIKESWLIILTIILLIVASDLFSSSLIKPLFQRLRPCHNLIIQDLVHVVVGCGGKYGFFSSHASNTFSLATFLWLLLKGNNKWFVFIFLWSAIVSYSRVYVGVHYPGDIMTGALVGSFFAFLFFRAYKGISKSFNDNQKQ